MRGGGKILQNILDVARTVSEAISATLRCGAAPGYEFGIRQEEAFAGVSRRVHEIRVREKGEGSMLGSESLPAFSSLSVQNPVHVCGRLPFGKGHGPRRTKPQRPRMAN
jgi:hypothetical protein